MNDVENIMKKPKKREKIRDNNKETENEAENKGGNIGELIGVNSEIVNNSAVDIVEKKKKKRAKGKVTNQEMDIEGKEMDKGMENEAGKKKGVSKGELIGVDGENISNSAADIVGKKKKKRDKGKEGNQEMEIEVKETNKLGENEVRKKGVSKGELVGVEGENFNNGAADIVGKKKKKRDKVKENNEAMDNEVNKGQRRSEEENIFEPKGDKKQKKRHEVVDIEARGKENGTFEEDLEVVPNIEKKKRKRDKDDGSTKSPIVDNEQRLKTVEHGDGELEKVKRKKKRATNDEGDLSIPPQENVLKNVEVGIQSGKNDGVTKKRERKKNLKKNENLENGSSVAQIAKKKKAKSAEKGSSDTTPNKSSEEFEFINNLVQGKRFTKEEDKILKEAVHNYIKVHDLGEEGVDMVMKCRKHRELAGCWEEIAAAIPYRPKQAIYFRAHTLFERSNISRWTDEEFEMLRQWQATNGNDWKPLAEELGKFRQHVKEAWRRIRLQNVKKGHWAQNEYQELFNLVNHDLQLKADEEKKSKHGMLRDNISWTAISDKLSTRTHASCCSKWYTQLTSPMVKQELWADVDDYKLLDVLYNLDANCIEDVYWDYLIEGRDGEICRRRWNEMVLHIGNHGNKSFAEQVEILAQRYCPKLIEAREAWDNKPRVP